MNNQKFAPSQSALDACSEVVEEWKNEHKVEAVLDEPARMLAARVNSWIGPLSVSAGVQDVVSSWVSGVSKEAMSQLGDRLGRRLMSENLLVASPRRGGSLGG